jgi:hypothetical protein
VAAKTFQEYYEQEDLHYCDYDVFKEVWGAATKAAEEKFTSTNTARDEILRLLDQTDKRLAANHVVHVGQLLDQIRAKLSPVT